MKRSIQRAESDPLDNFLPPFSHPAVLTKMIISPPLAPPSPVIVNEEDVTDKAAN